MANLDELLKFKRCLVVDAHPDDEVHCAALISRHTSLGHGLHIVILTDGDAGQNPTGRRQEMLDSARALGLESSNLTFLAIGEHQLLQNMQSAYDGIKQVADKFNPDCILSIDFDGGHEGHDTAAFLADIIAQTHNVPHITFPDYNWQYGRRYGLEFMPPRKADFVIELTDDEKDLKIAVLQAHSGQLGFYLRLQKKQEDYMAKLLGRELYRYFDRHYDFLGKPIYTLGYEHHRNGFKFEDFHKAAQSLVTSLGNVHK